jgi:hypothetical protein
LSIFNKHSIKKGQIITENRWRSNLFSGRIVTGPNVMEYKEKNKETMMKSTSVLPILCLD